jgi:hypothetical protein
MYGNTARGETDRWRALQLPPRIALHPPQKELPTPAGEFFIITFQSPSFCAELASWRIGMVSDDHGGGRMYAQSSNPQFITILKDIFMKRIHLILATMVTATILAAPVSAQTHATATQTVTLAINAVYKLSVQGSPTLSIVDATAGSGNMSSVSDASSTFSITQNRPSARLSVQLGSALPAGQGLTISIPSGIGTSAGTVAIGDGTSHNVMSSLAQGATNGQAITYTFSATALADPVTATAYTVTWTLAD